MSYGLMCYAVDLDKVTVACGSGDDKLRRMLCGRFRNDLQRLADSFADDIEEGAPSPFDAVRALIMGEPMQGYGFMYAYALEHVVKHFGRFLDNSAFYPCNTNYLEQIDAALVAMGAPEDLATNRLQYGRLPVRIPRPDDFPGYGHWDAERVAQGHAALAGKQPPPEADVYVREGVTAVQAWLAEAAARNEAIVGYYY